MSLAAIKSILITAGVLIGLPVVPDWGIQITIALAIGLVLPHRMISPIDNFVKIIFPPAKVFEDQLKNHERFKKLIPRIIAGYLFTFLIGITLISIGLLL